MAMLRKTVIALLAVASVGVATPTMALARGGGGGGHGGGGGGFHGGGMGISGGGFHGGGFGRSMAFHDGGFRGGEFHGHGFDHDRDFGRRFGFGGYVPYDYYDNYAYGDTYYDNGSCYVIQRRVHTTQGWRRQPVQVCG
jgi:hypothetical protein